MIRPATVPKSTFGWILKGTAALLHLLQPRPGAVNEA